MSAPLALRAVPILLVCALAAGCGGHAATQQAAKRPPSHVILNGGRLVDIGGGRSLYLKCVGTGGPTVVLEAGFGGNTDNWNGVQPQLGSTMRTCSYDRAGLGNSLPLPGIHDAAAEVKDLQRLLSRAHVPPPYILVGHSYGGMLVRLFAHAHPDETAGVVLVDAMGRNQDKRAVALWRAAPKRVRDRVPKPSAHPVVDGVDLGAGEALDAKVKSLGLTPLVVITRGQLIGDPEIAPPLQRPAARLWTRMQDELAALSPDSIHVVATRSGHFVQTFGTGQPGVVIRAVRAVADAANAHRPLWSCGHVFAGLAARCRG